MAFQECVIEVAQDQAEAWSDALFDLGALSVSVEDADADTPDEKPLFGEPGLEPTRLAWDRSRVVALFGDDVDPALALAAAANALGVSPVPAHALRAVEDQDWVRLTQSQFEPIRVGEKLWVVPSWHDAPEPDAVVLELDPGLAFGTGSHPTTRLCMEWLESKVAPGQSVLDYGCGSGILALIAKKVGAGAVIGVDIDPQALQSAEFNSERNHCEIAYLLPDDFAVAHPAGTRFDIVVANILSGPLTLMAPMLASRVAPGGRLVLSGILAAQAETVIAAYAPYIGLAIADQLDGWVALSGKLAGGPAVGNA